MRGILKGDLRRSKRIGMKQSSKGPIQKWGEKVNWNLRVKAVCKPCWELKYCPYGPIVEEFPLPEVDSHRSCRIFGHDCPVFTVAEPLTETRELRNVSRRIPRPIQFRVLKRENQVCRSCGMPVADNDIHFDHIIPWSKEEINRVNPRNGLCLNSIHDRAFDRGFLTITIDFVVRVSPTIKNLSRDKAVSDLLMQFDGKPIRLPDRFLPTPEFLRFHNENVFRNS